MLDKKIFPVKTLKHSLSMSFTLIHICERLQIEMFSLWDTIAVEQVDLKAEGLQALREDRINVIPVKCHPIHQVNLLKKPTSDPGS